MIDELGIDENACVMDDTNKYVVCFWHCQDMDLCIV